LIVIVIYIIFSKDSLDGSFIFVARERSMIGSSFVLKKAAETQVAKKSKWKKDAEEEIGHHTRGIATTLSIN